MHETNCGRPWWIDSFIHSFDLIRFDSMERTIQSAVDTMDLAWPWQLRSGVPKGKIRRRSHELTGHATQYKSSRDKTRAEFERHTPTRKKLEEQIDKYPTWRTWTWSVEQGYCRVLSCSSVYEIMIEAKIWIWATGLYCIEFGRKTNSFIHWRPHSDPSRPFDSIRIRGMEWNGMEEAADSTAEIKLMEEV